MNPGGGIKPNVSEKLATDLVHRIYGLKVVSIKSMVSYEDQNFHIHVAEDHQNPNIKNTPEEGYTLKITNTMKSAVKGHFDSMHLAMQHLYLKGLRVPLPVLNMKGTTWTLENVPLLNTGNKSSGDKKCGIHLLTYLPGVPVGTISYTKDILYQWGRFLGEFHEAIRDFKFPDFTQKLTFWDLEHIPEITDFMNGLSEQKTALVLSVLERYPEEISKNISNVPTGIIHGDFNENNILVQSSVETSGIHCYSVDGVLDFEDMHCGSYVWDVGMMLAYTLLNCRIMEPLEGAGHALAGYLSLRKLNDLELSLLKMCIACRLCQSLVLGMYCFKLNPKNSYCLSSTKTGWERLEQIWNTNNEDLLQKWREIQQLYCLSITYSSHVSP